MGDPKRETSPGEQELERFCEGMREHFGTQAQNNAEEYAAGRITREEFAKRMADLVEPTLNTIDAIKEKWGMTQEEESEK